ncbi:LysR family transcriptional regulator [Bacillus sp. FJAT-27231]|uniref:LysR family transcriptional regulator n=1 Tax=Bacillus sp. FJAT-27231 TaxID=1679168 RepID=UPI000670893C|nr:LysR family transcriptional regulator [Bacillus sp. FJAT-27231]KMY55255.1 LysR family transcriptional regulator [Bacillus sp. FJAT-27231]
MELRQLEYFMVLCEELHFTRASEKIGISQPTLSLQIRAIEQELGTPLFDRIGKRIALTEAGRILLEHCREIFHSLENAVHKIEELREYQGGHVSVGVLPAELDYRFTPLFIDFHKRFPAIHLNLSASTVEITKQVLDNEVDVGITLLSLPDSRLVSIPLYREEYVLVVSENHPLARYKSISLAELRDMPMVMYAKQFLGRRLLEDHCQKHGFQLNVVVETTTGPSLFYFVKENIGATLQPLPLSQALKDPALRLIKIHDHPPEREIGIIYRADKYLGFAVQKFIETVEEKLKHN